MRPDELNKLVQTARAEEVRRLEDVDRAWTAFAESVTVLRKEHAGRCGILIMTHKELRDSCATAEDVRMHPMLLFDVQPHRITISNLTYARSTTTLVERLVDNGSQSYVTFESALIEIADILGKYLAECECVKRGIQC